MWDGVNVEFNGGPQNFALSHESRVILEKVAFLSRPVMTGTNTSPPTMSV